MNVLLNYDKAGNVTIWRDTAKEERQQFSYDALNRLIAAMPYPVTDWQPALAAYTETYAYNAIGNFVSKGGVTQWYSDTAHVHAVTHFNGDRRAWYDLNGNMTQRVEMSGSQRITYTQEWDIENKLVAVTNTVAGQVTRFYRDADGNLVKKSDGAGTMMVVNAIFEHITTTNQSTSYYMFGGPRLRGDDGVAMRVAGVVYWLHGDHLGSASLTTSITGTKVSELRYLPFGKTRWMSGTTPTDRRFAGRGGRPSAPTYDYNARMYWPAAGRFVSADTVVPGPGNPQSFNRYAYVVNNPLRHTDPTGHCLDDYCGMPGGPGPTTPPVLSIPTLPPALPSFPSPLPVAGPPSPSAPQVVSHGFFSVIHMPKGWSPARERDLTSRRFGAALSVASVALDGGELLAILMPSLGSEDGVAGLDVVVTALASATNGETHFGETVHPALPKMSLVSQDVVISAGDLLAAVSAKVVLTIVGGTITARGGPKAAAIGALLGNYAGKGVDALTTAYNLQHDFRRAFLAKPLEYSVGITEHGLPVVVLWNR